jgi:hypothetical protein
VTESTQPSAGSQPAPPGAPAYQSSTPGYDSTTVGPKTNTLAIVSLVASLLGLATGFGFLVGIITGHISLSQIKKTGENGRGMALAGTIIGYVGILLAIIITIVVLTVVFATLSTSDITVNSTW